MIPCMKLWAWKRENLPSISHAFRTAVAATISILLGRLVGLPEAYWAAIASIGAIESTYFGANLFVFALAMLLLGLISFALRLEKVGYSYACITLTIIVLIPRSAPPWSVGLHRFIEVSVGIIVALAVVALWPEHQRPSPDSTAE